MLNTGDIIRADIEESINTLAWWYCCFPLADALKHRLALPLFFQYDDLDFSQRNAHLKKVTLNGVCVWHEPFEKKEDIPKKYYYAFRNRLIICALHGGAAFSKWFVIKLLLGAVTANIWLYRYKAADLALRAVEDFLKGFEWLAKVDPRKLNAEITASGYKLERAADLPFQFVYSDYKK